MIEMAVKTLWGVSVQCPALWLPTVALLDSASANGSDYGTGNMNVTASVDDPHTSRSEEHTSELQSPC